MDYKEEQMNKKDKIQKLVEEFITKDYGGALTHYEIACLIEEKEGSVAYREIVSSAQKKLLDCGKMIENVRGIGYRVVRPDEYTEQSAKCVVSGARRIDKGTRILRNAPVKDMSREGVQQYNLITDKIRILQAAVCGAKVEINMLSSKRENPLKRMVEKAETIR